MNKQGCCVQCEEPIYEVIETFPDGEPKRIGSPFENAREATLVLMSGSHVNVTFCEACLQFPDFPVVHRSMLEAWKRETTDEFRMARGGKPMEESHRSATRGFLWTRVVDPPLGVLSSAPISRRT